MGLHWDHRAGATEQRMLERHKKAGHSFSRGRARHGYSANRSMTSCISSGRHVPLSQNRGAEITRERESGAEKRMPIPPCSAASGTISDERVLEEMAYDDEKPRIVRKPWTVTIQGVHKTIPAGEQVTVSRDATSANIRVFWKGFSKGHLGFSTLVTEEELTVHT